MSDIFVNEVFSGVCEDGKKFTQDFRAKRRAGELKNHYNIFYNKELEPADWDWEDCCAFFTAEELKEAGYTLRELIDAAFTANELVEAGFGEDLNKRRRYK